MAIAKSGFGLVAAVSIAWLATTLASRGEPPAEAPPSQPPAAAPKLAQLKHAPTTASTYPWLPDYLRVLERFPAYHARQWHEQIVGGETLGYYGNGDRAGAASQARALLAIAYLASEPGYDPRPTGVALASLRAQALQSLRYLLRTHTTGDMDRAGGGRWGGDTAAFSVVAPLAAASQLLGGQLTRSQKEEVERVVQREADRLLEQEPAAGRPRDSRAPENAAAVECLAWAAALMPGHASAPRWEYQVRLFATNTLSAPQDRAADTPVDSRPVREWVTTENLLPDYQLESGGAVNPDAALQTLASLSGAYYAFASRGRPVPEALTHHYEDAWGAVTRLWLGESQLARPAGPATPPAAGPLFPVTALLEWVGSEPSVARRLERDSFQTLEAAQSARADGSFFGGARPEEEAAAAATLALAGMIHRRHAVLVAPAAPEPLRAQLAGAWASPAAAHAGARSSACFASWSWRGVGEPATPRGLFVALDAPELAAWGPDQLVGTFELEGFTAARRLHHRERLVEGGFTATGQIEEGLKEGRSGLHHFVAYAALPARRVAVLFDLALAAGEVTVSRGEGLRLGLGRESAGSARHLLRSEEGELTLPPSEAAEPPADRPLASAWLNLDDRLGLVALYTQEPFHLRPGSDALLGTIASPLSTQPVAYRPGQIVRDTVHLLIAADTATTTRLARAAVIVPTGSELVRAAVIQTPDGERFLVAANFGLKETTVTLRPPAAPPLADLRLPPLETVVRPFPP